MTIGASLLLIVIGAILYFATNWRVAEIDLDIVGLILMVAGAAGLVLGFVQQRLAYRRAAAVDPYREPDPYRNPEDPPPPPPRN